MTISLQRKQSPLDHHKVSISKIKTKRKKSLICAIRAMSQSNIAVGVTLGLYGGPSGIFKIRCVKFAVTLFLLSQLRHTEH